MQTVLVLDMTLIITIALLLMRSLCSSIAMATGNGLPFDFTDLYINLHTFTFIQHKIVVIVKYQHQ